MFFDEDPGRQRLLVVKHGDRLLAFEIKWSGRRATGRAFRDAYGVAVEPLGPDDPFVAERLLQRAEDHRAEESESGP